VPQAAAAEAAAAKEAAAAAEAAAKEAAAAAEAAAKEEAAAAAAAAAETVAEEVAAVPLVDGRTASNTFEPVSAVGSPRGVAADSPILRASPTVYARAAAGAHIQLRTQKHASTTSVAGSVRRLDLDRSC
jgi:membrane protein involved in colicin uptake